MKKIQYLGWWIFSLTLLVLGGCQEESLPTVQQANLSESPLLGTWTATERTVTVYNRKEDTTITIGNNVFYEDSSYTEAIEEQFTFGVEAKTDSVAIMVTPMSEDGSLGEPSITGGIWTSGIINDLDGPFSERQYILVLDPSKPRQAIEEGYYRTYTVRDLSENSLTLSYTATDRRDQNGVLYETTYQR